MNLIDSALTARRHGLSTVPVILPSKRPPKGLTWTDRQTSLPKEDTIRREMSGGNGNLGFAIIAGAVSGGLEFLDFDLGGAFYHPWVNLVEVELPGLINRLAIQQTMNGGFHVLSRCRQQIPGNTELARKKIEVSGQGQHEHQGKKYPAQQKGGRWFIHSKSEPEKPIDTDIESIDTEIESLKAELAADGISEKDIAEIFAGPADTAPGPKPIQFNDLSKLNR
jgi:hypothetical protein